MNQTKLDDSDFRSPRPTADFATTRSIINNLFCSNDLHKGQVRSKSLRGNNRVDVQSDSVRETIAGTLSFSNGSCRDSINSRGASAMGKWRISTWSSSRSRQVLKYIGFFGISQAPCFLPFSANASLPFSRSH